MVQNWKRSTSLRWSNQVLKSEAVPLKKGSLNVWGLHTERHICFPNNLSGEMCCLLGAGRQDLEEQNPFHCNRRANQRLPHEAKCIQICGAGWHHIPGT